MNVYNYPDLQNSTELLTRPTAQTSAEVSAQTTEILRQVRLSGDEALARYSKELDGVSLTSFKVSEKAIQESENELSADLKVAIQVAYRNIQTFHRTQLRTEERIDTMPGVTCWRKNVPISRVGVYIPGGSAPLFSTVLMLGIPAQLAGCQEVILCTPPQKDGTVHPAIRYCAQLCGIQKLFALGGAHAIAAMAYGTKTVPQVSKIFGPGNTWVTSAKQLVSLDGVAIDLPAGPSEVCVIADASANPGFVAADLLSQAEHGPDSQVMLITDSPDVASGVLRALAAQTAALPRQQLVQEALQNSRLLLIQDIPTALQWANLYAPEHLILAVENPEQWVDKVENAGSVFLGHYTPESAGDYASGTNHALPTNGYARGYSGVSVDSFVKKITFQQITPSGLRQLASTIEQMADAEGLQAHANAVRIRVNTL
ncbi:MAG: histidinol dehydrogenase [Chitinophagales bacterium]|nr:histidinol dehydrogenase [Chitinophagales bacterium]